jgi:hypothetical protein
MNGVQPAVNGGSFSETDIGLDRGSSDIVRGYEAALAAIAAHLDRERQRADRAERRLEEIELALGTLQHALADARVCRANRRRRGGCAAS